MTWKGLIRRKTKLPTTSARLDFIYKMFHYKKYFNNIRFIPQAVPTLTKKTKTEKKNNKKTKKQKKKNFLQRSDSLLK